MTLDEIKSATLAGECVCWKNTAYRVVCDTLGQWLIVYRFGGHNANAIGLTAKCGVKLNGAESDFYVVESVRGIEA
jgi:hypothetical protein